MPITHELLVAAVKDPALKELQAADSWVTAKACKAPIECRCKFQGFNQGAVTGATKVAAAKDDGWHVHCSQQWCSVGVGSQPMPTRTQLGHG